MEAGVIVPGLNAVTIYRFGNNSVIDEIAVRHSTGGGVRAYMHAREGADPAALAKIKNSLTTDSLRWAPVTHEGKPALEVRDIGRNGRKLLQFLAAQGATTGTAQKEANPEDEIKFKDKVRNNLLRLSGLLYTAGDIGFLYNGWEEAFENPKLRNPRELFNKNNLSPTGIQTLLSGIFYALGSPVMTFFGRGDKSDIQLRHLSYDALKFLESNGVKIPQNASILSVTYKHNANPWRLLKGKLERYPAEIGNSLFGLAGAMLVWSGIKRSHLIKQGKSEKSPIAARSDIVLGISTMLAGLVSLIEEEPLQPGEPKKTGFAGAWQFVKEKPLRMVAILLGISTVGHGTSTISDYMKARNIPQDATQEQREEIKRNAKGTTGRMVFTGTNLAAEVAMSFASKGHGEGVESDPSLKSTTYAVMADLIERSPPDTRNHVLELISDYLAKEENLNLPQDDVKASIIAQMQETQQNPWLGSPYASAINKTLQENVPHSETGWQNLVTKTNEPATTSGISR